MQSRELRGNSVNARAGYPCPIVAGWAPMPGWDLGKGEGGGMILSKPPAGYEFLLPHHPPQDMNNLVPSVLHNLREGFALYGVNALILLL